MSYTNLIYHLVFRPRSSAPVISLEHAEGLYRYIWGFVKEKGALLYRIVGMEDHREGRGDAVHHEPKRAS